MWVKRVFNFKCFLKNNSEIYYKYSPTFFELLPKETVDLWIKLGNQLNSNKLLPSMASCNLNDEQANEAIRYLEYCIDRLDSQEQSVHNNLLTLYLHQKPEKLLDYVKHRNVILVYLNIGVIPSVSFSLCRHVWSAVKRLGTTP